MSWIQTKYALMNTARYSKGLSIFYIVNFTNGDRQTSKIMFYHSLQTSKFSTIKISATQVSLQKKTGQTSNESPRDVPSSGSVGTNEQANSYSNTDTNTEPYTNTNSHTCIEPREFTIFIV